MYYNKEGGIFFLLQFLYWIIHKYKKQEQNHSKLHHNQLLKSSDSKKILKAARGKNTY